MNRQAVLYVYEIEDEVCAIVVGADGGGERMVAVDGSLDEITEALEGLDDDQY